MYDALRDLAAFVQSKTRQKHPWSDIFNKKAAQPY